MKTKSILPFNWRAELDIEADSIGDDLVLLDKPVILSAFQYPFRVDVTAIIICIKGSTEGLINLKPYSSGESCFITILPGQVMQYKSISEDFSGLFIAMSQKFGDGLMPDAHERLPLAVSVRNNPVINLNEEGLNGMIKYFEMLKRIIREKDHPYRIEVARYLTLSFFYGVCVDFHKFEDSTKKTHNEIMLEKFLNLIEKHHKQERGLEFYAGKLYITSKHLSKIIKEISGKHANDLIDEHVTFEAKALLKSTNMTIQQISDELNFPSQSFFGKYFKRVTGKSPMEYKSKG